MISSQNEILRADDLYHVYDTEAVDGNVVALRGIHIKIDQGEVVSVVGPSGSGKSTLMKCLGGLMKSSAGDVFFEGKSIVRLSSAELLNFRQQTVSFVFQDSNLLPYMNIVNNVALPLKYLKVSPRRARSEAMELLERLGIKDQAKMLPNQISVGEKQRTAIARSLITKPKIILADEPTGSLDQTTAKEVFKILYKLKNLNRLIIYATHNRFFANMADCKLEIIDGNIKNINARNK